MANYKKPEERASHTVTFRLTLKERQLLDGLAKQEKKSLTGLLRFLLVDRATRLDLLDELQDSPQRPTPPSDPAKSIGRATDHPVQPPVQPTVATESVISTRPAESVTFGDLILRFSKTYSGRAEGTQKELRETIDFLCSRESPGPLIDQATVLDEITTDTLVKMRESVKMLDMRLAKKNLHLTYLRMMLHWATKQDNVSIKANPARDLKPFTLSELPNAWPGRPGQPPQ